MKKAKQHKKIIFIAALILVVLVFGLFFYNNKIYPKKVIGAIEEENITELQKLLDYSKGNLNSVPSFWLFDAMTENVTMTPLQVACQHGNIEIVKLLLESGADANYLHWYASEMASSPLMLAVSSLSEERLELVKLLIEYGADPCYENNTGNDAMTCAVYASFDREDAKDIVEYLEQKGADIHKRYSSTQNTLLHKACEKDSFLIIKYLVEQRSFDINVVNADGDTPLIYFLRFASERNGDTLLFLLQNGADPTIKNNEGKTAYEYAVEKHPEFVELLRTQRDDRD